MRAARRHRAKVPVDIALMYRALLAVESVATMLSDDTDILWEEASEFIRQKELEEAVAALSIDRLNQTARSLLAALSDAPGRLNRLLADLSDGRFVLSVQSTEAPGLRRAQNARARLISLAILFVGAAVVVGGVPWDATIGRLPLRLAGNVILATWFLGAIIMWLRLR